MLIAIIKPLHTIISWKITLEHYCNQSKFIIWLLGTSNFACKIKHKKISRGAKIFKFSFLNKLRIWSINKQNLFYQFWNFVCFYVTFLVYCVFMRNTAHINCLVWNYVCGSLIYWLCMPVCTFVLAASRLLAVLSNAASPKGNHWHTSANSNLSAVMLQGCNVLYTYLWIFMSFYVVRCKTNIF